MTSKPTTEGQHGYQSECDPKESFFSYKTFSISFFRWERKSKGGLKKGKSFFRLVAPSYMRNAAFYEAERITKEMDNGWKPTQKKWTML